ncbi:MAG: DUF4105 domain-containing protein [Chitinophagales bacterium]
MQLLTSVTSAAKRLLLLCCLVAAMPFIANAKAPQLSDSAHITLVTVAPGNEIYMLFGHTGIRVQDDSAGFDVIFNYGTFDFEQPGFVPNFLRGKMLYMLSVDKYWDFISQYEYENRRVEEQQLLLTKEDKQRIFDFLDNNAQRENRQYYYDFFWDNCATRPRDVFEKVLGKRLQYSYAGFDTTITLKQCLKPYVANDPWLDFGFDLILGMPCEIKATPRAQTFLPDRLALLFEHATVDGKPFVTGKTVLLDVPYQPKPYEGITPLFVTFLLLMAGLGFTLVERIRKVHFWWLDVVVFVFAGFMGTFFLCMWIFTTHYSVPENLNMLWLLPTHLVVSWMLLRRNKPNWLRYYYIATLIILVVLLLGWKWNPQPYNIAVLPLILLLAIRALTIVQELKSKRIA